MDEIPPMPTLCMHPYREFIRRPPTLTKPQIDALVARLRGECLGDVTMAEVTETAVVTALRNRSIQNRSLEAMAEILVEKVSEKLIKAELEDAPPPDQGEDGRWVVPQGISIANFPFAGVRDTGQTITGDILRQGMIVLGLKPRSFAALFGVPLGRVKAWLKDEKPIPLGVAEYIEMRVARIVRGMAAATGTPIMVDGDILDSVPDPEQQRALEAMLQAAGH